MKNLQEKGGRGRGGSNESNQNSGHPDLIDGHPPKRHKERIEDLRMAEDTIIASAAPIEHPETEHGHKVPSSDTEINPKLASDIHYWTKEFGVTGQILHEAIRVHGVHVEKVRHALESKQVQLPEKNA